jgi:hypothetical protein
LIPFAERKIVEASNISRSGKTASVRALRGAATAAKDGIVGWVEEVFFDDEKWTVRYIIVRTGRGFAARRVLVSPRAVTAVDSSRNEVSLRLSRPQVVGGPDIDTRRPVSRQKELEYHLHFNFPLYWSGTELWGATPIPIVVQSLVADAPPNAGSEDIHLRSSQEVIGYRVRTNDGIIGKVGDFLYDAQTWKILYVRVDVGRLIHRRKVLVPHRWVANVSWSRGELMFNLTSLTVRNAPGFEMPPQMTADAERRIVAYYDAGMEDASPR